MKKGVNDINLEGKNGVKEQESGSRPSTLANGKSPLRHCGGQMSTLQNDHTT